MKLPNDSPFSAIESAIRATGARVTPARVRVFGVLQSAQGGLSRGEIEERLTKELLPGIDRVTIYRVLDWLIEAGLAHKATDSRGVFRFSAAKLDVEHAQHMHFRCTGCGSVFCLDAPPPPLPTMPKGFRLVAMDMDIRGECPDCTHPQP